MKITAVLSKSLLPPHVVFSSVLDQELFVFFHFFFSSDSTQGEAQTGQHGKTWLLKTKEQKNWEEVGARGKVEGKVNAKLFVLSHMIAITSIIMVHHIWGSHYNCIWQTPSYLSSPQFYKMGCLPEEITVKRDPRQADSEAHEIVFQRAAVTRKTLPAWLVYAGLFNGLCDVWQGPEFQELKIKYKRLVRHERNICDVRRSWLVSHEWRRQQMPFRGEV